SFFPGSQCATTNAPVPLIWLLCRLTILFRGNASSAARYGFGKSASTTTSMPEENTFQRGFEARRDPATTSAVKGLPSLNLTPFRRESCQRWSPESACHEVASAG